MTYAFTYSYLSLYCRYSIDYTFQNGLEKKNRQALSVITAGQDAAETQSMYTTTRTGATHRYVSLDARDVCYQVKMVHLYGVGGGLILQYVREV